MTQLLSKSLDLDFHVVATPLQYLFKAFWENQIIDKDTTALLSYI